MCRSFTTKANSKLNRTVPFKLLAFIAQMLACSLALQTTASAHPLSNKLNWKSKVEFSYYVHSTRI